MSRYALFAGERYYPGGGWGDFRGAFASQDDALSHLWEIAEPKGIDWAQLVDLATLTVVLEGHNSWPNTAYERPFPMNPPEQPEKP